MRVSSGGLPSSRRVATTLATADAAMRTAATMGPAPVTHRTHGRRPDRADPVGRPRWGHRSSPSAPAR